MRQLVARGAFLALHFMHIFLLSKRSSASANRAIIPHPVFSSLYNVVHDIKSFDAAATLVAILPQKFLIHPLTKRRKRPSTV